MFRFLFLAFTAALICSISSPALTDERFVMDYAGMDVFIYDNNCSDTGVVKLEVRANAASQFDGARADLQRLIGGARAVISLECSSFFRATIKGTIDGNLFFAGATESAWNWEIIGLFSAP